MKKKLTREKIAQVQEKALVLVTGSSGYNVAVGEEAPPPEPPGGGG